MAKSFEARCPCCAERLLVNLKTGRLELVDRSKKPASSLLDEAGDVLGQEAERAKDRFDAAFEEEKRGPDKTLDDLI